MNKSDKSYLILALIALVATGKGVSSPSQEIYTRSEELPAMRMKYSDLESILTKASQLATEANRQMASSSNFVENLVKYLGREFIEKAGPEFVEQERQKLLQRSPKEEIAILSGGGKISIPNHSPTKSNRLPEEGFGLNYNYDFELSSAPVASISLVCRDIFRTLEVRGGSADNVDAVMNTLMTDYLKHSTRFGGYSFRTLARFAFFFLFVVSLAIPKGRLGWFFSFSTGAILLGTIFLPSEQWFPGFAVYRDDPAFLVRYGPQIGFAGVILSIFGIVISLWPIPADKRQNTSPRKRTSKKKVAVQTKASPESTPT